MFKPYIHSFLATPRRVWAWSGRYPWESVGYGAILLFLSLAAQPLLAAIAGVAIVGGLYQIFKVQK